MAKIISEKTREKIIKLLKEGKYTIKLIGELCGVGRRTISTIKKEAGLTNIKEEISNETREKIIELLKEGHTIESTRKLCGVGRYTVLKINKETRLRTTKKIPDEIKEKIIKLLKEGKYTIRSISKRYKVAECTISIIKKGAGLTNKKEKIPEEIKNKVEELLKEGKDIGLIFELCNGKISKKQIKGIRQRMPKERDVKSEVLIEEKIENLLRLKKEGKGINNSMIAKLYGQKVGFVDAIEKRIKEGLKKEEKREGQLKKGIGSEINSEIKTKRETGWNKFH